MREEVKRSWYCIAMTANAYTVNCTIHFSSDYDASFTQDHVPARREDRNSKTSIFPWVVEKKLSTSQYTPVLEVE